MNAIQTIKKWRKDPVQFVKDNFKVNPDVWQEDALNAYISKEKDKFRIALLACAGP